MKDPTFEEISLRAYLLWEKRGRPEDQQASIDCWLQAERELWDGVGNRYENEAEREREELDATDDQILGEHHQKDVSNLDRSQTPQQRRATRDARNPARTHHASSPQKAGSFLVILNRRHLRFYDAARATPSLVQGYELTHGQSGYAENDTDQAGRHPGSARKGRTAGGSIDERLPMQEEQERRIEHEAAEHILEFLNSRPRAKWSFAAGPALLQPVLQELPKFARDQLVEAVSKDLANVPLPELTSHFHTHPV